MAAAPQWDRLAPGSYLLPRATDSDLARLTIRYDGTPPAPDSGAPRLGPLLDLARGNPAARMLRLLETLALGVADDFSMALLDGRVEVRVTAMLTRARILELIPASGDHVPAGRGDCVVGCDNNLSHAVASVAG